MGSSYAMGLGVSRESSFAALLPVELSRQAGRNVELYNEGMYYATPRRAVLSFNEVLAANPDMILWEVTPWDLGHVSDLGTTDPRPLGAVGNRRSLRGKIRSQVAAAWRQVKGQFGISQWTFLIQHFLYKSSRQYLRSYLVSGDDQSGFLKSELSANWQNRLRQFDTYATALAGQANAKDVPFVAVLVPNRAQAAMISMGEWPADYDPYKLDEELRNIITGHGGIYIDILPDFRDTRNPEQHYYPVDDHPDADGHAMIARMLAKELTDGTIPALSAAAQPLSKQGR